MLVKMICPQCGANLNIDSSRESFYCEYCGIKIANISESININQNIHVEHTYEKPYEGNLIIDYHSIREEVKMVVRIVGSREKTVYLNGMKEAYNLSKGSHKIVLKIGKINYNRLIFIPDDDSPVIIHATWSGRAGIRIEQPENHTAAKTVSRTTQQTVEKVSYSQPEISHHNIQRDVLINHNNYTAVNAGTANNNYTIANTGAANSNYTVPNTGSVNNNYAAANTGAVNNNLSRQIPSNPTTNKYAAPPKKEKVPYVIPEDASFWRKLFNKLTIAQWIITGVLLHIVLVCIAGQKALLFAVCCYVAASLINPGAFFFLHKYAHKYFPDWERPAKIGTFILAGIIFTAGFLASVYFSASTKIRNYASSSTKTTETKESTSVQDKVYDSLVWENLLLGESIPEIGNATGIVKQNTQNNLSIKVMHVSSDEYADYVSKCKAEGYSNFVKNTSTYYSAYAIDYTYLNIQYDSTIESMEIELDAVGRLSSINWDTLEVSEIIPDPSAEYGKVKDKGSTYFRVKIGNKTTDDFEKYLDSCRNAGFSIEEEYDSGTFTAYNEADYKLICSYNAEYLYYYIELKYPREFNGIEWPSDGVVSLIPVTPSLVGSISLSTDSNFKALISSVSLEAMEMYVSECKEAGFCENISENPYSFYAEKDMQEYYAVLNVSYAGHNVINLSLYTDSSKVNTSTEETTKETAEETTETTAAPEETTQASKTLSKIKVSYDYTDFYFENYKEVVEKLKAEGFTNITAKPDYDIIWGITEVESIDDVSIGGNKYFREDDEYDADVEIIVRYHMNYEDDPDRKTTETETDTKTQTETETEAKAETETSAETSEAAVYFSTNTRELAKQGNSGVFAYADNDGQYKNYYIINFDEGYVYSFADGNGSTTCERLAIEGSNLNDGLRITWHDTDGSQWSENLYFTSKRQPDHLVMKDHNGFTYDYYGTNLEDALEILKGKTIRDY